MFERLSHEIRIELRFVVLIIEFSEKLCRCWSFPGLNTFIFCREIKFGKIDHFG